MIHMCDTYVLRICMPYLEYQGGDEHDEDDHDLCMHAQRLHRHCGYSNQQLADHNYHLQIILRWSLVRTVVECPHTYTHA